jgi:IS5 family transposase
MAKKAYRVRNWSEYNKELIKRGSITVWVDERSRKNWYEKARKSKKRGRQKLYSDAAIVTLLIVKQVYGLTLRSCEGFMRSLMELWGKGLKVPHYSRVSRRQGEVTLPQLPRLNEGIHLVIDASGLKVYGEGEWKVRQHGWSKRRMWRKLHVGVDEQTGLIVSAMLTQKDCSDTKQLPRLVHQYQGKLKQVSADGAYDSHDNCDEIEKRGAKITIPPQPNPEHHRKKQEDIKRARDKVVWEVQCKGRACWKQASGYHRRSKVENAFYRYKRLISDKLQSRKLANQRVEAWLGCHILNEMTLMGMPQSVPVE